jgi:hypothetical protein
MQSCKVRKEVAQVQLDDHEIPSFELLTQQLQETVTFQFITVNAGYYVFVEVNTFIGIGTIDFPIPNRIRARFVKYLNSPTIQNSQLYFFGIGCFEK